jgi:hypothetical protein
MRTAVPSQAAIMLTASEYVSQGRVNQLADVGVEYDLL